MSNITWQTYIKQKSYNHALRKVLIAGVRSNHETVLSSVIVTFLLPSSGPLVKLVFLFA